MTTALAAPTPTLAASKPVPEIPKRYRVLHRGEDGSATYIAPDSLL
jgi:hypothetical protein